MTGLDIVRVLASLVDVALLAVLRPIIETKRSPQGDDPARQLVADLDRLQQLRLVDVAAADHSVHSDFGFSEMTLSQKGMSPLRILT
jgi:hypothetical protein